MNAAVANEFSFAAFLTKYRRDCPIGDLAGDFRDDSRAPHDGTDTEVLTYLRGRATHSVQDTVESAWKAYQRARRKAAPR